ncbi:MAG: serine/threonine protein kinase, partial [Myxococcales bacterium]|nr:serine/threonine protein kinase [Myxococcales bacterium]
MDPQNPSYLPIGGTFDRGRYRVERCIAAGGMGAVYEVQHLETRRRRALKVMLPSVVADPDMRARFRREATVAADIESEHIAEVLDAGIDDATGAPFIVMELLKGQELAALVTQHGPRQPAEAVVYLWHAALALDKAHAIGVIHRDLKPENLFVTYRDDGAPRVKLLDFGIAKVLEGDKDVKATRGVLGTPLYISPEQIASPQSIGPATDAYALAQIAYTLLVGEPYWAVEEAAAETVIQLLMSIATAIPEPPSERARARRNIVLPPAFDAWFARATADKPAARYPGVLATVAALAEALGVPLPAHGAAAVAAQLAGGGATSGSLTGPGARTPTGRGVARSAPDTTEWLGGQAAASGLTTGRTSSLPPPETDKGATVLGPALSVGA